MQNINNHWNIRFFFFLFLSPSVFRSLGIGILFFCIVGCQTNPANNPDNGSTSQNPASIESSPTSLTTAQKIDAPVQATTFQPLTILNKPYKNIEELPKIDVEKIDARSMEEAASSRFITDAARQAIIIGDEAPNFMLPDQNEKIVRLEDYKGQWVVIYFYPKDDTPGCTCQATEFTGLIEQFEGMNAVVLGISHDAPESHLAFSKKYEIKIPLLSDLQHSVMEQYSAWHTIYWKDKKIGRIMRTTVLIDPQGNIAYYWPEVIPTGHAKRVQEKLVELQKEYLKKKKF